ncbi:Hypothetical predicted protein [Podarcis lilfordi]|uniref:Uncharacterized protein n=1 Tax=Podarcis lilfordi TaxID=74358 RepID=A0AA35PJW7_9SAUR|nr:Hypothetical predicted protein [Podarcis lilfordi]
MELQRQDGSGFAKWHRENVNNLAASLEKTNRRTYWPLPLAFSVQNSPRPRGSICGIKNFLCGMPPRKAAYLSLQSLVTLFFFKSKLSVISVM